MWQNFLIMKAAVCDSTVYFIPSTSFLFTTVMQSKLNSKVSKSLATMREFYCKTLIRARNAPTRCCSRWNGVEGNASLRQLILTRQRISVWKKLFLRKTLERKVQDQAGVDGEHCFEKYFSFLFKSRKIREIMTTVQLKTSAFKTKTHKFGCWIVTGLRRNWNVIVIADFTLYHFIIPSITRAMLYHLLVLHNFTDLSKIISQLRSLFNARYRNIN